MGQKNLKDKRNGIWTLRDLTRSDKILFLFKYRFMLKFKFIDPLGSPKIKSVNVMYDWKFMADKPFKFKYVF